jgi:hypothetical protein
MKTEMVEVEVWVMVDEEGNYEVADTAANLNQPAAGVANRIVKVKLNVPKPRAVELEATIAEEPDAGELKAA